QRKTKLSTSKTKVIHKLSTRIINVINRFNVRQTVTNADLKRFTDDIRTIRRQTVSNVRKSYPQFIESFPQANKSYPQVIHTSIKLSTGAGKLSTSYPQAEANVCSAGRGGGGERVFESPGI